MPRHDLYRLVLRQREHQHQNNKDWVTAMVSSSSSVSRNAFQHAEILCRVRNVASPVTQLGSLRSERMVGCCQWRHSHSSCSALLKLPRCTHSCPRGALCQEAAGRYWSCMWTRGWEAVRWWVWDKKLCRKIHYYLEGMMPRSKHHYY